MSVIHESTVQALKVALAIVEASADTTAAKKRIEQLIVDLNTKKEE